MLRLLAGLFLAATAVVASNVPVFSSNDDYDEINLNIRLLKAHKGNDTSSMPSTVVTVTIPMTVACTSTCTVGTFQDDTAFTGGVCDAVKTAGGVGATTPCAVTVSAGRRRARQLQNSIDLSLAVALTIVGDSVAAVESLAASITAAVAAAGSTLTDALVAAAASIGTATVGTITTATAAVVDPSATAATGDDTTATSATTGGSATSATTAADSSNAIVMKANVALAAGAALVAALFA